MAAGSSPAGLAELAAALRRRAADHPGHVRAPHGDPEPRENGLVLSVWRSVADLRDFVRASSADVRAWTERTGLDLTTERVLWWTEDATPPEPREALSRLSRLREHGPGPAAFTVRSPVPPSR